MEKRTSKFIVLYRSDFKSEQMWLDVLEQVGISVSDADADSVTELSIWINKVDIG